ncbi:hypothetical protein QQS21_006926 [Conoideocrella luteorostrata]|uniref:Uncharacterized protein n=1 Tax=Conoideocrella luteorostrata TaxID=1105319 RepID=A0AAJ0CR02_9HYPO|nr:hypothetical protein QQS21_006926 [Conoideocrella luteorostrata]
MEDDFLPVITWQGLIMVSTSLLPQSSDEKRRIYSDSNMYNLNIQVDTTMPPLNGHNLQMDASGRPPVPNYWQHEHYTPATSTNDLDPEMSSYHTPSASDSAASSTYSVQSNSPAVTPQTDDDTFFTPGLYPPVFLPWESTASGGECNSPIDFEDQTANTSARFFPMGCHLTPTTPLMNHTGLRPLDERRRGQMANNRQFTMPTHYIPAPEGSLKRRRLSSSWHH